MKNNFYQSLKMRLWHVPWLIGTFILSLLATPVVLWFAAMGQEFLVYSYFVSLIISHLIAFGVGFVFRVRTWRTTACLCGIALLPPIFFGSIKLHTAWYVRFHAVYDRFRDNLANPIPKSVSHLEFIPLKETFVTDLFFRFEIAPDDLDKIIQSRAFKEIGTNGFARKDNLFTYQNYLPLSEPVSFYIYTNEYEGVVDMLKVSNDRKKVVFRRQSFSFYTNEDWGNNLFIKEEEQKFIRQLSETNHP